jgi:predicted nucleotidyltransferase
VFGSFARGEDRPDSDIDLLVELPTGMGLLTLGHAQQALEDLLGSPVDLVPEADLKLGGRAAVAADLVRLGVATTHSGLQTSSPRSQQFGGACCEVTCRTD